MWEKENGGMFQTSNEREAIKHLTRSSDHEDDTKQLKTILHQWMVKRSRTLNFYLLFKLYTHMHGIYLNK